MSRDAEEAPPSDPKSLIKAAHAAGQPVLFDLLQSEPDLTAATFSSFYLTMRDGIRIAIDLWLPDVANEKKVPTALRSTRYWRSHVGNPLVERVAGIQVARWMKAGLALVQADARGTGASFGTWPRAWTDDQRDDLAEIVDWVIARPWSDGTVGGFGTSYDGTTAHLLASTGHDAVRAIIPRFALFDAYYHIAMPGGVPLDWFLETWSSVNWHLDGFPDRATVPPPMPLLTRVRPVEGDEDAVEAARIEHADNWDLWKTVRSATSREELVGADGVNIEEATPFGRIEELHSARVPMWVWSSWFDGAYSAAALAQLADPNLDVRVTIGPWSHGAGMSVLGDPFASNSPLEPDTNEQHAQMAGFLRHHADGTLRDPSPKRLRYYTLGHGWEESESWPPEGSSPARWWLGDGSHLTPSAPEVAGADRYEVDFEASTGTSTRWHTLIGGGAVAYPDRANADRQLLTWTSGPLAHDLKVTGTPSVHLSVTSTRTDGAFFVYLEDVAPDGHVTYVTEGQLRAVHRRLQEGSPPYATYGPWHSYSRADVEPLVPGKLMELSFTMWPVSVLFPAGHSIRVALAGADTPLFRRVPADGAVTIEVHRPGSFVDLPTS